MFDKSGLPFTLFLNLSPVNVEYDSQISLLSQLYRIHKTRPTTLEPSACSI